MKTKRPWGSYTVLSTGKGFKVKLVEVRPHKRLSLQSHQYRSEHWTVVQGLATVTLGNEQFDMPENESAYISKKQLHRLENKTNKILRIVEVQCGDKLLESDIKRFDDDYGRTNDNKRTL